MKCFEMDYSNHLGDNYFMIVPDFSKQYRQKRT